MLSDLNPAIPAPRPAEACAAQAPRQFAADLTFQVPPPRHQHQFAAAAHDAVAPAGQVDPALQHAAYLLARLSEAHVAGLPRQLLPQAEQLALAKPAEKVAPVAQTPPPLLGTPPRHQPA